jgi:hypothetical protein
MRFILVSALVLAAFCLGACSVMLKDKVEIEKIAEDIIEEIAEDLE